MIIGISGKSGSGKTTLSNYIKDTSKKEVIHLDIDKVGHKVLLLDEVKEELINTFGEDVINNELVNRKRLGEIVFDNRDEMQKLTDITWKYMQLEIDKYVSKNTNNIILILDWLLLPITKYFEICDIKILLDIPYEVRKKRAMQRDNITEEQFDLREKASIELDRGLFDYILESNNKEEIRKLVKRI